MDISIIICTRNRARSLKPTLESISRVEIPSGWEVELIVVDNGSSDDTARVVAEFQFVNMTGRYISEPKAGQCRARNAGLKAAAGEIILFTDDDIRFPANWVVGMCKPIMDGAADAVAGGVVFPAEYESAFSQPPLSSRRGWFASTYELDAGQPVRMVGANMAFHTRVLANACFDHELGPGALGFGDDTLFGFQLLAAGRKLISAFDFPVVHWFDLGRLTKQSLVEAARRMGRSHAFLFHHWEHKRSRLAVPRLALCALEWLWVKCTDRGGKITARVLRVEEDMAFYREYLAQRRRAFKHGSGAAYSGADFLTPEISRTAST